MVFLFHRFLDTTIKNKNLHFEILSEILSEIVRNLPKKRPNISRPIISGPKFLRPKFLVINVYGKTPPCRQRRLSTFIEFFEDWWDNILIEVSLLQSRKL